MSSFLRLSFARLWLPVGVIHVARRQLFVSPIHDLSLSNFPFLHPNFFSFLLDLILKFRLVGANGCDFEFLDRSHTISQKPNWNETLEMGSRIDETRCYYFHGETEIYVFPLLQNFRLILNLGKTKTTTVSQTNLLSLRLRWGYFVILVCSSYSLC